MNSWIAGLLLAGGLVTGCGSKSAKSDPAATNAATAGGNPITAPVDYLGAVGKAQKHSAKVVDTVQVQQAIQQFHAGEDRFPKDLEELVKEGYLGAVPKLPTGFRYQYDAGTGRVKAAPVP
jgi:hypothetical protein